MELQWQTMTPTKSDFEFWIKNKYNVLFIGGHGIGKTTLIKEAFKNNNLNSRYFSASTMDPWVDFIGVPKEQVDETGAFLDLVKPKEFRDDTVQALFFDEYNRAPGKVQNAVMELIQFKSINGRKFENLSIVWAAINDTTDSNEYNVEKLDPAQLDRFHIIVRLPSKPQLSYFRGKFGKKGEYACKWWDDLSQELKAFISPRRLDYILDIFDNGGDIRYALPQNANVKTLIHNLKNGDPFDTFKELTKKDNNEELKKWLANEVNFSQLESVIISKDYISKCLALLNQEKQAQLLSKYEVAQEHIEKNPENYSDLVSSLKYSTNKSLRTWANTKFVNSDGVLTSSSPLGAWTPHAWKDSLVKKANNFKDCLWDKSKIETTKDISIDKHNSLLAKYLTVAPSSSPISTYQRLKNLDAIVDALKVHGLGDKEQIKEAIQAINYFAYGFQDSTIRNFLESYTTATTCTRLFAAYIVNEGECSESPQDLFSRYHSVMQIMDQLSVCREWVIK